MTKEYEEFKELMSNLDMDNQEETNNIFEIMLDMMRSCLSLPKIFLSSSLL